MVIDYSVIVPLIVEVIKNALPLGIIFLLAERLVNMFLSFAFPRTFKGGL